ncbi:MAG: hypothetical protein M8861_09005, partial [marine benthic group bacterium]|nr:hypothetical protein [Gemmatimonadota bacterium]
MRYARVLAVVLGLVLRLLAPTSGLSQGVQAEPGSIVTAPVPVPEDLLEAAGNSVAFAIEVPAGVALVSPRAGTFVWEDGDPLLLPVTIRVPETVRAGPLVGLNVTFAVAGLQSSTVPVPVTVRSAHQLSVDLVPLDDTVERGGTATFRFVVSNSGNAADSVDLEVMAGGTGVASGLPASVWLEPFEVREGQFSVAVPENAVIGKTEYVRLTAAGTRSQGADHATYAVAARQGLFPNLVQIPTTLFLGSTVSTNGTLTEAQPVLSINGGGQVGHNTDVLFSYRLHPEGSIGYAFRGLFASPGLYMAVRRPSWEAAAGDLNPRLSPVLGYSHQSRGITGAWRAGRASLNVIGGRPQAPDGGVSPGHVAAVELGYRVGFTRTGVLLSSTERESPGVAQSSVQAALVRVDGSVADHTFGLDAGPMRVEDRRTGEVEQGPSLGARYAYRNRARTLDLRALVLPKLAADPRLPASQLRASGSLPLSSSLLARASAFNEEAARTSYLEGSRVIGGEAGLRLGLAGWSAGLAVVGREVTGRTEGGRRNLRLDGSTRVGDFGLDGTIAFGQSRLDGVSEFFQRYRVGASWRGSRASFNLNFTYSDDLLQPASFLVDASGTYQATSRIEVFGVVTSFYDRILDGVPLRTVTDDLTARIGTAVKVGGSLKVYAGVERLQNGRGLEGEWRFSAGIQQGVALPLPVRRPATVSGIIYEDVDGDGQRGPEDVLLDGATLRMGFERAVSRPGGRFDFRSADPATVAVETRSLGSDYLPMPDMPVPDDRYLEIAVTRSADLRVSAFLDSNV